MNATYLSILKRINNLESEMYYRAGDTYVFPYFVCGSYVTSMSTQFRCTFMFDKRLKNVQTKIVSGDMLIRTISGTGFNDWVSISDKVDGYQVTSGSNYIDVLFTLKQSINVKSDTPVGVCFRNLIISFE